MLPDRVSNPGPLTYESGALQIALRGPALTQVDFATRRPVVFVGAVCEYLDLLCLPIPYLPLSFRPLSLLLYKTVRNLLKHCPLGQSNSSISSWKQLTR